MLSLLRKLVTDARRNIGFINEDGTDGSRFNFKSLKEGAATYVLTLARYRTGVSDQAKVCSHIVAAFDPDLQSA